MTPSLEQQGGVRSSSGHYSLGSNTALKAKLEELKVVQQELNDAIKKKAEYADKVCTQADALKKMEEELGLLKTR